MMRFFNLAKKSKIQTSAFLPKITVITTQDKRSHPHGRRRRRSAYQENITAALALPLATETLESSKANPEAMLALSKESIIEHAHRRVDLFFYTLIAYYKTHKTPEQDVTNLQHGRGRNSHDKHNILQACHSSLIPSFIDDTHRDQEKLKLGHKSILCGTHFMHSLNSTVELPAFVNEFDSVLETSYSCRTKSMRIIKNVSEGKLNPIQGLNLFLKMLDQTFIKLEENYLTESNQLKTNLVALVRKSTSNENFFYKTKFIRDDYIESMLRLTEDQKLKCSRSHEEREHIYLEKILALQKEILTTQEDPNLDRRLKL
ncbi:MAG: hypothetical protein ABI597_13985 [Gammaproteobacteria bacterium]